MNVPPELVAELRSARYVMALTGSGISAESGVPTFRDAQTGLWARYDPTELATPEAFERDPGLVWEWYSWRRELVRGAEPNVGHRALAELEQSIPRFSLVTQNVDGLHQRAGSRAVIELHGSIERTKCSAEGTIVEEYDPDGKPPLCPHCGAFLRPDVVWFGEMLPQGVMRSATRAARDCDVLLSVGTSILVYPAAGLPHEALGAGATLVEVNPAETPISGMASFVLRGPASEALPSLVDAVRG